MTCESRCPDPEVGFFELLRHDNVLKVLGCRPWVVNRDEEASEQIPPFPPAGFLFGVARWAKRGSGAIKCSV